MWIDRDIEPLVAEVATQRPAVVVTGSRQAGKTSLLERLFPGAQYVSLDDPLRAEEAEHGANALLERLGTPAILDEIQYAPHLLRHLKVRIDRQRRTMGQYLLTGSQRFQLMQGVTESLAGRVGVITCHSLAAREIERHAGHTLEGERLLTAMLLGGYPEVHLQPRAPGRFFGDYLATYLERDVRHVLQVRSLRDFTRFMRLIAGRCGQLLNAHAVAADLGVSAQTVRSWLAVLEASNVVYLLEPYFDNSTKRLVKTPKLYFLDTGLLCYLAGIESAAELARSQILGALFENHVVAQLLRWFANRGEPPRLSFYRDHEGHEVDLVREVGGNVHLMECKFSERMRRHVPAFEVVRRRLGDDRIASQTLVTPARGRVEPPGQVARGDSIDFAYLSS